MTEEIRRSYFKRCFNWLHDTLLVTGLLFWILMFGGARLIGYYFDFGFVPIELTQPTQTKGVK